MEPTQIVPGPKICEWLVENGWRTRTFFQYRKGSLRNDPLLIQTPEENSGVDIAILFGEEEYRHPAPTVRELFEALPSDITVSKTPTGDWHVIHPLSKGNNIFKIEIYLEDALALMWIMLQKLEAEKEAKKPKKAKKKTDESVS